MRTVITNYHAIDAVADSPWDLAYLIMEDGRIVNMADSGAPPDCRGGHIIDSRGSWLLPSLWDVHAHLTFPRLPPQDLGERAIAYGLDAMSALQGRKRP